MSAGYDKAVVREAQIRVDLSGSPASAFQNLASGIQDVESEIQRLLHSVPQNAAQMAAWQARIGSLVNEYDRLGKVQAVVEARARGQNVATVNDIRRQEASARAILEVSRALEDFSVAGWRGALNNVPVMMYNIGQAAGLTSTQIASMTGVFSTVLVAATVLVQNWRGVWRDNLGKILENWDGVLEAIGQRVANPTMLVGDVAAGVEALGNAVLNAFAPTFENAIRTTLERTKSEYEAAKHRVDELAKESRLTSEEMAELTYGREKVERLKAAYDEASEAAKFLKIISGDAQTRSKMLDKVAEDMPGGGAQVRRILVDEWNRLDPKGAGPGGRNEADVDQWIGKAKQTDDPAKAEVALNVIMATLKRSKDAQARDLLTKLQHETPEVQKQMKALEMQEKDWKADAEKAMKAKAKADREKEQKVRAAAAPVAEGRRFEGPARIAELAAGGMDPVAAADQYAKELAAKIPQYGAMTADVAKAAAEKMLGEFESRRQELLAKGLDPGAIPARVKADMEAAEARAKTEAERAAEATARAEGRDAKAADQRAARLAREYSDPFDEQIRAAVARNELMQAQFAGLPARMAAMMSRQQYGAAVRSDADLQASLASEVAARLQAVGARDDTGKAITPAEAQAVASKIVGDAVQDTNRRLAESAQMSASMGEAALMLYRQTQADLQRVMADQALILRQYHDAQFRRAHAPTNRP